MNRQIDTDHKRLIPAIVESNIIHIKGERKPGMTSNSTKPACPMACKVVMRYTPHSTKVEIHVAGEEKKGMRYGDVSQASNVSPPKVNRIAPPNFRRRSAILRWAN